MKKLFKVFSFAITALCMSFVFATAHADQITLKSCDQTAELNAVYAGDYAQACYCLYADTWNNRNFNDSFLVAYTALLADPNDAGECSSYTGNDLAVCQSTYMLYSKVFGKPKSQVIDGHTVPAYVCPQPCKGNPASQSGCTYTPPAN